MVKRASGSYHSCGSGILQDLPLPSVAHAFLTGSLVGPHLETNHIFARLYLIIWEFSLVLLRFPTRAHRNTKMNLSASWGWTMDTLFYDRTHLKNQFGSPWYVPSSLVTAKLPRAERVLCTAARSLPADKQRHRPWICYSVQSSYTRTKI